MLELRGSRLFRQRIVFSLLSCKPLRIKDIRSNDENPGLREHEIHFLRLIQKVTNGTYADINYSGTSEFFLLSLGTVITFKPGVIVGGKVDFDCGAERAISYFLEPILPLLPFSKNPVMLTLSGLTTSYSDSSVEMIKFGLLPVLRKFGVADDLELKVVKRGYPSNGDGAVEFYCSPLNHYKPVDLRDAGTVTKVRGLASSCRTAPSMCTRVVQAARQVIDEFCGDAYIHTDVADKSSSGSAPAYSVVLYAECDKDALYCIDDLATENDVAEDVGTRCAKRLLSAIAKGDFYGGMPAWLPVSMMAMTSEDVNHLLISPETDKELAHLLSDLKQFFGVTFRRKSNRSSDSILISCIGAGLINHSTKIQ